MIRITGKEWLYLAVALIGGILGGAFSSRLHGGAALATEAAPKRIAAQEIVLVDAAGGERAVLHLNDNAQPVFEMMDHAGKARVGIGFVGQDEVALRMADRKGTLRIALNVSPDEVPALRLFDSQARPRTLLGVDTDGDAALDFYESSGKLLRELP
ncbi:MAG TPA: hypothetical protein VHY56_01320 [Candidatus Binataceae bacterium]|jgi:hypothetical protein|nr:hypothetical protein [Candidatus Binataceae bacterium]